MSQLSKLQNGSDIRGVAIQTETHTPNLTQETATKIALGIVTWLRDIKGIDKPALTVAIGHDGRLSGEGLQEGMIEGFISTGARVYNTGLSTTPAMFMATQFAEIQADVGIMITASHLPYFYNGIKVFTKTGGAEHEDIAFILENSGKEEGPCIKNGVVERIDLMTLYAADMVAKIRANTGVMEPLKGNHIVLDAGNGAGGFFAPLVLEPLGAETRGSQFLESDGHFPNHMPNPDNKEAMESIQEAVLEHGADLGVIFDTDVDRAAVVDGSGMVINRNNLIAVLASMVLEEQPGSTIVTNSPTSSHLKTFIEGLGGKQYRYLCGYRNVINQAIEMNEEGIETPLAIETSGHAAFKENYFLDDGAYVIAKILMLLPRLKKENKTLTDVIGQLKQPIETKELRFKIMKEDYQTEGYRVISELEHFAETVEGWQVDQDNYEGVRINVSGEFGSGWLLLRLSLHEPLLVLQIENDVAGKTEETLTVLGSFLIPLKTLDTTLLLA